MSTRYDKIGVGYTNTRQEDPELYNLILEKLGDAKSVINVGAGTGSYEPKDREVIAIEPSEVMIQQRKENAAKAIKATSQDIPLEDNSYDAAMTVLSIHHWHPDQEKGIREMCRVARNKIVIVTFDSKVCQEMWLMKDYMPEVAGVDEESMTPPEKICEWLGPNAEIEVVPTKKDTPDWHFMSFWAHPERVFDPAARAGTSGFSRQPDEVINRVIEELKRDLDSGEWDKKYGELRTLAEYDAGLRIITASLV